MITESERNYLLAEFSESFQHLGKLDDRRFEILQFYSAFLAAVVAVSVALLGLEHLAREARAFGVVALLCVSAVVSWTAGQVLKSERRATERYRRKLNAIRGVFKNSEASAELSNFLSSKDISIDVAEPGNGGRHDSVATKDLKFSDLFRSDRRCTALYIKALIDTGMVLSLLSALLVGYLALT